MVTPLTANGKISSSASAVVRACIAAFALFAAAEAHAAPPKIRTDAGNVVPRCVTPSRLMAFLKTRNPSLDPRYADIASLYKKHGEAWRVRWDYAFFQMALETNFLTYRKGDGGWGDVNPKQNNFAGLGTTGGGVPGDSYPNVSTGVLAQVQHLVVYSGERIEEPVGARTRLKQDDIIETMASKRGSTTFGDLARRWAADKRYGASIEWVANSYRESFCKGPDPVEATESPPKKPKKRVSEARQEMVRAANLGGPLPDDSAATENAGPPVRTIWSAANTPRNDADKAPVVKAAAAKPQRKPAPKVVEAEAEAAPAIATEQLIQTGSEQTLAATDLAPASAEMPPPTDPAPVVSNAPSSGSPAARPAAFAYAAALGTALPKPRPEAKANASADAGSCNVASASYGGKKVLLVRSGDAAPVRYTVLSVLEGFEKSMLQSYLKAHAPNGSSVGEFANKDAAFARAKELCAGAAGASRAEASAG